MAATISLLIFALIAVNMAEPPRNRSSGPNHKIAR
jgi:hypothetical protein